jgi:hypothetical protein
MTEQDINAMRNLLHDANTDANHYRDALKDILALCLENRRGIVAEIEHKARQGLQLGFGA